MKKAKKTKCPICEGSGKITIPAPVHYDHILRHWISKENPVKEQKRFCLVCKGTGFQS